jgi:hypothetical protein
VPSSLVTPTLNASLNSLSGGILSHTLSTTTALSIKRRTPLFDNAGIRLGLAPLGSGPGKSVDQKVNLLPGWRYKRLN